MSRSPLLPVALVLVSATVTAALAGCSSKEESLSGTRSATTERAIDVDDILDDATMTDDRSMTVAEVQSFLEHTPYGHPSVLASYRPKGKPAAQIIVDTAREYALNPKLLLVRAQLEQALVSKQTATPQQLDRALGCGCVDTPKSTTTPGAPSAHTCSARYVGFENQVRCAASTLRHALDGLAGAKHATRSGWSKGTSKATLDGIEVTPKNDATAALYSYTPWVGKLGGGRSTVGGTSAHWQLWNDFDPAVSDPATGAPDQDAGGRTGEPDETMPPCEGTCRAGEVCSESGSCVAGCQVLDAVDSCPSGSRCDRSDGLVGHCRAGTCACAAGTICDPSSGSQRCVQCTIDDTTSCRAEGAGDGCVAGRCGCRTNADCGYDRARICDPVRGVCIDDLAPSKADPASPDPDAGVTSPAEPEVGGEASTLPEPAPTPDLPSPSSSAKGSSASKSSKAEETIDVPGQQSGGCSTGAPRGGLGAWGIALALVALGSRSRARGTRARR